MNLSVPQQMAYPEDESRLPWLSLLTAIQDVIDQAVFIMLPFSGITHDRDNTRAVQEASCIPKFSMSFPAMGQRLQQHVFVRFFGTQGSSETSERIGS